jgi:hypothetical protein
LEFLSLVKVLGLAVFLVLLVLLVSAAMAEGVREE